MNVLMRIKSELARHGNNTINFLNKNKGSLTVLVTVQYHYHLQGVHSVSATEKYCVTSRSRGRKE